MKLSDWHDLCEQEWAERLGDVIALSLTGPSASELAADCFASVSAPAFFDQDGNPLSRPPSGTCGIRLDRAANFVTGTVAAISHGAATDTATVRYESQTRTAPRRA